jgi:phosphatidylglycerol:prolipoprotein diacylglycerol transferase
LRVEVFGIALGVGLLLGVLMSARLAELAGLDRDLAANVLVITLFGALLGARLVFVLENLGSLSFREALALHRGGLSAYGALLFGSLAALLWLRRQDEPPWPWFDVAAPGALLTASVARLGSHLGASDMGRPLAESAPVWLARLANSESSSLSAARPSLLSATATHPVALYEASGALALGALLLIARRYQRSWGEQALLAAVGYSVLRASGEAFRERVPVLLGLTSTECYALTTATLGVATLAWRQRVVRST